MEQHHYTNGAVTLERRLTGLEKDRDWMAEKLLDVRKGQQRVDEHQTAITKMAEALTWMREETAALRDMVVKMQAEQHRIVLGTTAALGGLLLQVASFGIQALRAKLGF